MSDIPLAPVDRLLRKAGCPRVSEEAAAELALVLEKLAVEIGQKANLLAQHAGRKTVVGADIKLAEEEWRKK